MLGIQIYTVRSLTETPASAESTVAELKKIGYECIQLAGSIEVMENCARAAKKCGMRVIGILTNVATLTESFDKVIEIARSVSALDIGISGGARTESAARELVVQANGFAKRIRAEGFSFSYHNHSHEFIRTECGLRVMDILLDGFDEALIDIMPDTYWLQHGGIDVREFIETYGKRTQILHLKDMKRTEEGVTFAEVGAGNINMSGVIKLAKSLGIKNLIVEQDICDGSPLDSAKTSYENLKKIIGE